MPSAVRVPVEFEILARGEVSGREYPGKFRCWAVLSHQERLRRDQIRRDLLGPNGAEAGSDAIVTAEIFSQCLVRVCGETPTWWRESNQGRDLLDVAPIRAVYDEVMRVEREYLEALNKEGEAAKEELRKPDEAKKA